MPKRDELLALVEFADRKGLRNHEDDLSGPRPPDRPQGQASSEDTSSTAFTSAEAGRFLEMLPDGKVI